MRKLFRMKYESCSGQCYAYSDVMRIHVLGLDVEGTVAFLKRLLAAHAPSCGNDQLGFKLDVDETTFDHHVFVASFQRYGALDLFLGKTPMEALDKMIDGALAYYQSDEFKAHPTTEHHRHVVCHHGTDEKLVNFALEFSGLDAAAREAVRARFA